MKHLSIKKIILFTFAICFAISLTSCELFLFADPKQYHVCVQLSYTNHLFSLSDIMFFRGFGSYIYDNYKRNGDEIEKIIINKEGKRLFKAQDRIDFYDNYFYVSDYEIEGKTSERVIILSVYNDKYELLKQIVTPINWQKVYCSCFSKSGNYYYIDHKNEDNDLYDLYRFNIWNEENELLFENVEKYTRIMDGDEIIIVDSNHGIKNLSYNYEYYDWIDYWNASYMINDLYYEIIQHDNTKEHSISICCEGILKKKIAFECDAFNIRIKVINDNIVFCILNNRYTKNCIRSETGYRCVCQLGSSTVYKYNIIDNNLEIIRSFQPETFIIDFNDENIKYYYDGALYNNDDKICDFKLNYDKDNLTSFNEFQTVPSYNEKESNEKDEYWKFVGSKIKFLMIGDEIYYYNGLYNKYTVLEV